MLVIVLENVSSKITLMCIKETEKVACKRFFFFLSFALHSAAICLRIYEETYARRILLYKPDKQSFSHISLVFALYQSFHDILHTNILLHSYMMKI